MTTATTEVVKEDLKTPADAFDMGAGRIRLDRADTAGLVFDESATRLTVAGGRRRQRGPPEPAVRERAASCRAG